MELDFTKEVNRIAATWNNCVFSDSKSSDDLWFSLWGPKGCGKTKMAQDYVKSHANAFYISFEQMTYEEAVKNFCDLYVPGVSGITTMEEAVHAFMKIHAASAFLIFEEERNKAHSECINCFVGYCIKNPGVKLCFIETIRPAVFNSNHIAVRYRTLADFCKIFQSYKPQDVLRIHAMTGGIPAIAKEIDPDTDLEENISRLLSYDSAFTTLLPGWLADYFRSPESYYPIIQSIASGHHRLSEIAKDIGFPNNKCGKYLEALIVHDFVKPQTLPGAKQATYYLSNSYFIAWGRYAYGKRLLQIAAPDRLKEYVLQDMDDNLCLPAFTMACDRYVEDAYKDYLYDYHSLLRDDPVNVKKSVPVKLRDGSEVILDYFVQTKEETFIFIYPHSVDIHYTKKEMKRLLDAIEIYDSLYYTHINVFSIDRFSDWCVHQASVMEGLHEVTIERLKY